MTDIVELERRVAALEADVRADRRDIRRMLQLQEDTLAQAEGANRRAAAVELAVSGIKADVAGQFAQVNERLDRVEGKVDAFIRNFPGMIAETMREVMKETRGGA